MNVVVSRPYDDKDIVEVYIVDHEYKSGKAFQIEWNKALAEAKKAAPETWHVGEVIEALERRGWSILHVNEIKVTY